MSTAAFAPNFRNLSKNVFRSQYKKSSGFKYATSAAIATLATAAYFYNNNNNNNNKNNNNGKKALFGFGAATGASDVALNTVDALTNIKQLEDYQKIYNAIALKIREEDDHDDGSFGPILVRLAWHNSGTFNKDDKTKTRGGSYGATMRYSVEQNDPENAGLNIARDFLEPIKKQFPDLSYGDLWTLGGVTAIQELNGPKIPWRPGRADLTDDCVPPYHRLPDASQETGDYVRSVFANRMGFTDKEMVCLIGVGHAIGRCHPNASGFDGPWTFSPTMVTNEFFKLLLSEDWKIKQWSGKRQYEDSKTKSLMMLPTDMVLKTDSKFRKYVEEYANDEAKCMSDFADVFSRLLELGIKFPDSTKKMTFKTLDEQDL
ncbi:hypothetical protein CANARDRAFT_198137 [[Candida] arabinofermentans NRRL YB-2248]|uniref:Peroxidase n=1 Tax=[Candida] arabinofermentans NRRL YB-2248 TaxID=983967 RepID=A0A1E4T212_9ASCO|nr:hypothetical protein CANARDRAFT_198137 [[Candida] arabinofermentans NRRL YB-2248]